MLRGMMMDRPLLVSSVIDYAAEVYPDVRIVSQTVEGGLHRYGYAQARERIGRLANALVGLGIKPGDRVATLAWNGYRHFELYFAIAGIGAVCHTINPRLFPEQITYIANHAEDTALFFDATFLPLVEKLKPALKTIKTYTLMTDRAHMPANGQLSGLLCYEGLLAEMSPAFTWPEFDENAACALCYTSGTTGEPKGVLYSNRSMLLHTFFLIATRPDLFARNRTILPVVPLFHANAWSLPYVTPLTGCPIILPGAKLDGPTIYDLMENEGVESGWGVPTVWLGLLDEFKKRGRKPKNLVQILSGGSAVPQAMIDTFTRDYDIEVTHGWGMTELSPVGTLTLFRPEERAKSPMERAALSARQGRRMFGVDLKVIDEKGNRAPPDGETSGELFVRGRHRRVGLFQQPGGLRQADRQRRLVCHRRRRQDHAGQLAADRRPHQGPREVRRRVDQLHRCRERGARREGRRHLRCDRRAAPQVERAAAAGGRQGARRQSDQGRDTRRAGRQDRQVADARRRGVRRRPADDGHRQDLQERLARQVRRSQAAG